jgi:6-pyruvoyltetrahydropterin/6-carboxytetrahydropterin synthase
MYELSKEFWFDAAHTLVRTVDAEPSRRIHGHSYRAEVVIRGRADLESGMVVDLGHFHEALAEARDGLDHRLLDEIEGLGPGTMENLSAWIWRRLAPKFPNLSRVVVRRDSDSSTCAYFGPGDVAA